MMNRRRTVCVAALLAILAAIGVLAFLLGERRALTSLAVRQISPDQAAAAMQSDEFYSDYNETRLVIRGSVASIQTNGDGATLQFATHSPFKTFCQLAQYPRSIHDGAMLTVLTEGASAQRQSSGVVLSSCSVISGG
jgi:hypothetical protein